LNSTDAMSDDYEERDEVPRTQGTRRKGQPIPVAGIAIGLLVVIASLALFVTAPSPPRDRVPYRIVSRERHKTGGLDSFTQTIVISPQDRTTERLRVLDQQLRWETAGIQYVEIAVYDEDRAAKGMPSVYGDIDRPATRQDVATIVGSFVGVYSRFEGQEQSTLADD
jgi:hypothetical protein